MPRSGGRAGSAPDELLVWHGLQLHCLLEESIEQEAASFGSAAIEAERELVQIVIKLGGANSPMVNTQPPPIKEAGYPMNLGHDNVGWVAAGGNIFRLVFEADSRETVVGSPAIGSCIGLQQRSRFVSATPHLQPPYPLTQRNISAGEKD